jgi:hypothetical protein
VLLDGLGFRRSTAITPTDLPLFAYANRLVAMEAQMKREGTWYARHPWMDLFVASDAVDALLSIVLDELDPCWLVDSHTLTYPVSRAACRTPLVALGAASLGFLFGVGPNFTATDDIGFVAFEHACQRIYERSRELQVGVYPVGYPVGTPAMTEDDWRRQLPRAWEAWCAAKRQYDPHGLLPQLVTPASQG